MEIPNIIFDNSDNEINNYNKSDDKENSINYELYVPDNENLGVEYPLYSKPKRARADVVIFVYILIPKLRVIVRISILVESGIKKL